MNDVGINYGMKKILFAGGIIFTFSLFLIVSNFSINSDNVEPSMRSIDFSDYPEDRVIVLHETEIGNQYIIPTNILEKFSLPNTLWKETHIALQGFILGDNVQKDITYEYFSEMPPPSQFILDRYAEKLENPMPRKTPLMEDFGNQMLTLPNEAINVDDSLDVKKK